MIKFISVGNRIFDAAIKYLAYLAAAILLVIAASICLDVALRYTINLPLKWVFETTEYSLLFITFLATTWVLQKDGHVKLDLVLNAFRKKVQAWINTITSLVMAGVCVVLTWSSINYTLYLYQNHITIEKYYTIPQFAVMVIIPIGFFLLFIQSLKKAYYYFQEIKAMQA